MCKLCSHWSYWSSQASRSLLRMFSQTLRHPCLIPSTRWTERVCSSVVVPRMCHCCFASSDGVAPLIFEQHGPPSSQGIWGWREEAAVNHNIRGCQGPGTHSADRSEEDKQRNIVGVCICFYMRYLRMSGGGWVLKEGQRGWGKPRPPEGSNTPTEGRWIDVRQASKQAPNK